MSRPIDRVKDYLDQWGVDYEVVALLAGRGSQISARSSTVEQGRIMEDRRDSDRAARRRRRPGSATPASRSGWRVIPRAQEPVRAAAAVLVLDPRCRPLGDVDPGDVGDPRGDPRPGRGVREEHRRPALGDAEGIHRHRPRVLGRAASHGGVAGGNPGVRSANPITGARSEVPTPEGGDIAVSVVGYDTKTGVGGPWDFVGGPRVPGPGGGHRRDLRGDRRPRGGRSAWRPPARDRRAERGHQPVPKPVGLRPARRCQAAAAASAARTSTSSPFRSSRRWSSGFRPRSASGSLGVRPSPSRRSSTTTRRRSVTASSRSCR